MNLSGGVDEFARLPRLAYTHYIEYLCLIDWCLHCDTRTVLTKIWYSNAWTGIATVAFRIDSRASALTQQQQRRAQSAVQGRKWDSTPVAHLRIIRVSGLCVFFGILGTGTWSQNKPKYSYKCHIYYLTCYLLWDIIFDMRYIFLKIIPLEFL